MAESHSQDVENRVRDSIVEHFEQSGMTDKVLARELTGIALNATKVQSCRFLVQDDGGELKIKKSEDEYIELPDYRVRKDALDSIAKMKKHMNPDSANTAPTNGTTPLVVVIGGAVAADAQRSAVHADGPTVISVDTSDQSA